MVVSEKYLGLIILFMVVIGSGRVYDIMGFRQLLWVKPALHKYFLTRNLSLVIDNFVGAGFTKHLC
ncbi:MAG: hypothetical protein EAZ60_24870 [Oscillatoriales cyanobacterium]|nr:MAG: hypothetical protein EAZ83_16620 [Oscillatoriales cyanobacterium]TAF51961.1 MAG: hypothetical protein EAZ60_24870 [Oscillatoriales cyanobacterium]